MVIVGIGPGTSNSAVAVLRGGRLQSLFSTGDIGIGGEGFLSYVAALTGDGQTLMGESVRHRMVTNSEGTATAFKRRMGNREVISLRDEEYSPDRLSAFLPQKVKCDAGIFLGNPMERVGVAAPAYFDDNQHAATRDACGVLPLH